MVKAGPAVLGLLEPEVAHQFALFGIKAVGLLGSLGFQQKHDPLLKSSVAGLDFANPIGLAAGLDKNGIAVAGLFALGFGSVEIGTLTPVPQAGNSKPRLFRLKAEQGLINRYGFNNAGIDAALQRIATVERPGVLGVNVGANRESHRFIDDFVACTMRAKSSADYITLNISSPNTPGLRNLHSPGCLQALLAECREVAGSTPLFLKISPDLSLSEIDTVAKCALDHRISALIVSNTSSAREASATGILREAGGLSGRPIRSLAAERLRNFRTASGGRLPLIASGGIDSGAEAYSRITAGASLVQIYTALVYHGPWLAVRIANDLTARLASDGHASLHSAIGSAV